MISTPTDASAPLRVVPPAPIAGFVLVAATSPALLVWQSSRGLLPGVGLDYFT